MATRRKSSGFTAPREETAEIEEFLEENVREMFETFSQVVEAPPQIIEEIVPTEDPGPRFVEEVAPPAPVVVATPAPQPVTSKRHPRNIPKFSRTK